MRLLPALLLVSVFALGGCGRAPSSQAVPAGSPTTANRPSAPFAPAHSSIPALEFVDGTTVPNAYDLPPNARLSAGSYRTFLTGAHVTSVSWGANQATGHVSLDLVLDDVGTRIFAQWTAANVGKPLVFAIRGRAIRTSKIESPIRSGRTEISFPPGSDLNTLMSRFNPEIVRSP